MADLERIRRLLDYFWYHGFCSEAEAQAAWKRVKDQHIVRVELNIKFNKGGRKDEKAVGDCGGLFHLGFAFDHGPGHGAGVAGDGGLLLEG
jgi:hypothetical protein